MFSWFYLIWLNVLCCLTLGHYPKNIVEEERNKKLPIKKSESSIRCSAGRNVQETVDELMKYDVISFDIFDTLIFRPFSSPTDLFI